MEYISGKPLLMQLYKDIRKVMFFLFLLSDNLLNEKAITNRPNISTAHSNINVPQMVKLWKVNPSIIISIQTI